MKLFGIISVGFDVTDQLLIGFFAFVRYWREKMGLQLDSTSPIHRLQESEEGSILQYSHRVWGTHENSQVD
jgi:hypothetical protein